MIDRGRLLSLGYYKKASSFTGSDGQKLYKIERITNEDDTELFLGTIWPGPYSSENTPDEIKLTHTEPFTEEGLVALVSWMNATPVGD